MSVHSLAELAMMFGIAPSPSVETTQTGIARAVYTYTDCGAWITFGSKGIQFGSMIADCPYGTAIYSLSYPFEEEDFDMRIDAVEAEADHIRERMEDDAPNDDDELPRMFRPDLDPIGRCS